MKKFKLNKISIVAVLVFSIVFSFNGTNIAHAASAPTLGVAAGYSLFGNAGVHENTPGSIIWGDVGENGAGNGSTLGEMAGSLHTVAEPLVVSAISSAYGQLSQPLTQIPVLNLAVPNTVGPGVYDVAATAFTAPLTLSGAGVYIFKSTSSIAQAAGGTMILTNGATACNVFWQIPIAMTFAAVGNIEGTIIAAAGISLNVPGITLKGRAWAGTLMTLNNDTITQPICAAPAPSSTTGTINVVKTVINDNGGTKVVSDFPLFVNGTSVVSGVTNSFRAPASVYTVTETSNSNYTRTFSGDCDINGQISLSRGDNKFCIITNNDIGAPVVPPVPPLIDVVKTALPLSLPNGPGPVTYTYTLHNIGTVPVTNITMVGDTCSPIVRVSGDTNNDNILDVNETWVHTCSTTLQATHTNTVVATGWANGISAVDIASATVVVGIPIVPPIIHVTKIPSPLTLSAKGGIVTYTNKVTNPGIVALSNVRLSDDKCNTVKYISGDTNADSKLDVSETWIYTCLQNLTKTTTNTVTASGEANGLTARDFAIATVVVAAPSLPKTGLSDNSDFGQQVRTIANSLGKGSKGSNVIILQQFLISQDKGPKAKELSVSGTSLNFGPLTKAALAEWQKAVGITPATGNFGSITRAYLKAN